MDPAATPPTTPGRSGCRRSTLAYPSLLAAQRGYALDFRACSGYAPTVDGVLGFGFAVTPAVLADARAQGPAIAASQQRYAAADRQIQPQPFEAPDLQSTRVRQAATAHGIDLQQWLASHT